MNSCQIKNQYLEDVSKEIENICLYPGHLHYKKNDCEILVENWDMLRCRLMHSTMKRRDRCCWIGTHYFYAMKFAVQKRMVALQRLEEQ